MIKRARRVEYRNREQRKLDRERLNHLLKEELVEMLVKQAIA
ncbi:hypothetical protein [Chlorogloeopsis sp. ULAP02]